MQSAPALLTMVARALASFAAHNKGLKLELAQSAAAFRFHSFSTAFAVPSRPTPEFTKESQQRQFVVYGERLSTAVQAPERCLSACELNTQTWEEHVHACLNFTKQAMAHAVAVSLCLKAVSEGSAILLIRPPEKMAAVMQSLSDLGVDTKTLIDRKGVWFVNAEEFYLKDLEPMHLAMQAKGLTDEIFRVGAKSLTFVGETHYPFGCEKTAFVHNLIEYEKLVDSHVVQRAPIHGVCMYDSTVYPCSVMDAVLHAHRTCVACVN
eukprot:TRINITY_DN1902_c0_g1_i2.p1 TRINITY_DN1902_c0_g1~~TRINITY_DN1902_c0_g1_i2.p1  ORF type:complete len:265 (+),score=53.73 TRINITY_DN1902_c0_g1_i2:854-1648(+)